MFLSYGVRWIVERGSGRFQSKKIITLPFLHRTEITLGLIAGVAGSYSKKKEMSKITIEKNPPTEVLSADNVALWARFSERFRGEVGDAIYSSWFQSLELDAIAGGVAYLSVPTKFLKSWIHAHYLEKLRNTIIAEIPGVREINIELRSAAKHVIKNLHRIPVGKNSSLVPFDSVTQKNIPAKEKLSFDNGRGIVSSTLDRRFSFGSFLVGSSNQLAYAAAQQVVNATVNVTPLFNPLYLFSDVGLGKTHLIQAIAHACYESGRRVIYLTAEKFMYGFVSALKRHDSLAFKDQLREIDLLVIDDVQFLQGKTIQSEFCHTLNALIDAGRQVIIAGDRAPNELENLDERVKSRFSGGLSLEIQPLDEELRRRILEMRIENIHATHPEFNVTTNVIAMVAKLIDTNGRDLEGAVNRLLAHTILAGCPLTLEAADAAIRDLVRVKEPKKVKIEDIQKLVATHFNVSRADILSSRRTANVVRPRQIAMYLAKTMTFRSLPEIGRRFGGRDHTTVLHAVRKIEEIAMKDSSFHQELEFLKRLLGD